MINFKEKIAAVLAEAIEGLAAEEIRDMLEIPTDSKMGDYAFPCFKLAKVLRKAPPMIAQGIAEKLQNNDIFEKVENVNAYVNMFLSRKVFMQELVSAVAADKERYGSSTMGQNRKVIVEFSSPNIAKPFHIGHNHRGACAVAMAAHAPAKGDARAGNRPLKRPQHQFIAFDQIETHPEKAESLLQRGGDVGQVGHQIGFAAGQGFELGQQACVNFAPVGSGGDDEGFSHKSRSYSSFNPFSKPFLPRPTSRWGEAKPAGLWALPTPRPDR